MSRKIIFRAWNKNENFMDSAWLIDWEHGKVCHSKHNQSELEDCVLMQNTGIKDANGLEIYEGDILNVPKEYSGSFWPVQVVFENGAFRTQISHMHNPVPLTEARALTLEIIGNIYKTPELLKQ